MHIASGKEIKGVTGGKLGDDNRSAFVIEWVRRRSRSATKADVTGILFSDARSAGPLVQYLCLLDQTLDESWVVDGSLL